MIRVCTLDHFQTRFPVIRVPAGSGNASFGPHRARDLLQLKDGGCFSPSVDPLHALHIFGIAGPQVRSRGPLGLELSFYLVLPYVAGFFSLLSHRGVCVLKRGPEKTGEHTNTPWIARDSDRVLEPAAGHTVQQ